MDDLDDAHATYSQQHKKKQREPQMSKDALNDLQLMLWVLQRIPTASRARVAFAAAIATMPDLDSPSVT